MNRPSKWNNIRNSSTSFFSTFRKRDDNSETRRFRYLTKMFREKNLFHLDLSHLLQSFQGSTNFWIAPHVVFLKTFLLGQNVNKCCPLHKVKPRSQGLSSSCPMEREREREREAMDHTRVKHESLVFTVTKQMITTIEIQGPLPGVFNFHRRTWPDHTRVSLSLSLAPWDGKKRDPGNEVA